MRSMRLPCLVIAPSFCRPPEECSRNQTQVAGHLLAAREAADIAQGQHVGQRRDRTDSGLGLKKQRHFVSLSFGFDRLIQRARSAGRASPSALASRLADVLPTAAAAARARSAVRLHSTACASAALLYSGKGVAVRSSPAPA